MGVPSTRTPVRVARGTYSNLTTTDALAALQDGEIAYATDTNTAYVVETESGTKALKAVTGIPSSDLIDEDNMASDSATKVPSQQSVKAYVDAGDLSLIDEDNMSTDSATRPPSQQSVKAYVDTQVATKQASEAELTELATMASGTAGALADLLQAEVEILDGATLSTTELNYVDGVTSAIQTQLNAKGTSNVALSDDNVWSGAQRGTVTTATHSSGATYDFDLNVTNCFKLTISAAVELGFSNMTAGTAGTIEIVNSGSTVPTWATEVYFAGGTSKAPTITASATTVLAYYCFDSSKVLVEGMSDVKNSA